MSDERGAMNEVPFIAHHSSLIIHRSAFIALASKCVKKPAFSRLLCGGRGGRREEIEVAE
jgi:hypothetical protein